MNTGFNGSQTDLADLSLGDSVLVLGRPDAACPIHAGTIRLAPGAETS